MAPDGSKLLWSTTLAIGYGAITSLFMAPEPSSGAALYTGNADLFGTYAPLNPPQFPGLPATPGTPGLFAAKLKADGSGFTYIVDLGQSADARAAGLLVGPSGEAYLAGASSAAQLIPAAGTPNLGADFVLTMDASGAAVRPPLRLPHGAITAPPALDTSARIPVLLLAGAANSLLTLPANYSNDSPAIVGFANSASFALNTGLYPRALVTLFGFDLPASSQGVQVLINGIAAPVLFADATQINFQAPFETGPYSSVMAQVVSPLRTISLQLPTSRSIGLFTTDGVHAAALNQDGTVNSASNPAAAGSIVTLFGTGAIWPSGLKDGATAAVPMPLNQQQNKLEALDWTDSPLSILYAGAAPGLIDGVFQVNVQLPPSPPATGFQPVLTLQSIVESLSSHPVQVYIN